MKKLYRKPGVGKLRPSKAKSAAHDFLFSQNIHFNNNRQYRFCNKTYRENLNVINTLYTSFNITFHVMILVLYIFFYISY